MEKQETVDKVLDVLREFAGEIGGTAKELWPHAVAHYQWTCISNIMGGVIGLLIGAVILLCLFKWLIPEIRSKWEKGTDRTVATVMCTVSALFIAALVMGIGLSHIVISLPGAIEPVGGLLREILGK